MLSQRQVKRFYSDVSVCQSDAGYTICLDGNTLKTPASKMLIVNSRHLIEAVASEWEAQEDEIITQSMPLFRLVATSIDRVEPNRQEINEVTLKIGKTDLLCYRAGEPPELAARQVENWQPLIAWANDSMGTDFIVTEGLSPIPQPLKTINALEEVLSDLSDLEITAVSSIAATTSSLIISLAFEAGIISAKSAAEISIIDEVYQMERWGQDKDTVDRHNDICQDIHDAGCLLKLIQ